MGVGLQEFFLQMVLFSHTDGAQYATEPFPDGVLFPLNLVHAAGAPYHLFPSQPVLLSPGGALPLPLHQSLLSWSSAADVPVVLRRRPLSTLMKHL